MKADAHAASHGWSLTRRSVPISRSLAAESGWRRMGSARITHPQRLPAGTRVAIMACWLRRRSRRSVGWCCSRRWRRPSSWMVDATICPRNGYPQDVVHPPGYKFLREFRLDPFPTFVFRVEGVAIEKRVFLVHGQNAVVIEYEFRGLDQTDRAAYQWELRPLVAFRDDHVPPPIATMRAESIDSQRCRGRVVHSIRGTSVITHCARCDRGPADGRLVLQLRIRA